MDIFQLCNDRLVFRSKFFDNFSAVLDLLLQRIVVLFFFEELCLLFFFFLHQLHLDAFLFFEFELHLPLGLRLFLLFLLEDIAANDHSFFHLGQQVLEVYSLLSFVLELFVCIFDYLFLLLGHLVFFLTVFFYFVHFFFDAALA